MLRVSQNQGISDTFYKNLGFRYHNTRITSSGKEVRISPAVRGKSLPKNPYLFRTTELPHR